MLYKIQQDGFKLADLTAVSENGLYAGLITLNELQANAQALGFSQNTVHECTEHARDEGLSCRSLLDNYEGYSFGIVHILDAAQPFTRRNKIGLYIKKNLFLLVDIVDHNQGNQAVFRYALDHYQPESISIERLIYAFFECLIADDNKNLELMEGRISDLEDVLSDSKPDQTFNRRLMLLKKELLALGNYYAQLIDIGEALQEDANALFGSNTILFKLFTDKVTRLCDHTRHLRDSLMQLREAYQTYMDYNINKTMKTLTIMATVFMPLTLIVGWYGMNFTAMPELVWKYGYIYVIVLCILTVLGCVLFFKRKDIFK